MQIFIANNKYIITIQFSLSICIYVNVFLRDFVIRDIFKECFHERNMEPDIIDLSFCKN